MIFAQTIRSCQFWEPSTLKFPLWPSLLLLHLVFKKMCYISWRWQSQNGLYYTGLLMLCDNSRSLYTCNQSREQVVNWWQIPVPETWQSRQLITLWWRQLSECSRMLLLFFELKINKCFNKDLPKTALNSPTTILELHSYKTMLEFNRTEQKSQQS